MENYFKRIIKDKKGQGFTFGVLSIVASVLFAVASFWKSTYGAGTHESRKRIAGTLFFLAVVSGVLTAGLYTNTIPGKDNLVFPTKTASAGFQTSGLAAGQPQQITGVVNVAGADSVVTFSGPDFFTGAASGGSHRYKVRSTGEASFSPLRSVTDGNTATLSPGDLLSILFMNETLSPTANDVYFSKTKDVTVGLGGSFTATLDKNLGEGLYRNGTTLTLTVEDNDGAGNLGTGENSARNLTMAAGEQLTLTAKLKGSYQRGYPYGLLAIVEYNATSLDNVIVNFQGVGLESVQTTNVPISYVEKNLGFTTVAYEIPQIIGSSEYVGEVFVDADDASGTSPALNATHGYITIVGKNMYVDEKDGSSFKGPAADDEDNNFIGLTNYFYGRLSID